MSDLLVVDSSIWVDHFAGRKRQPAERLAVENIRIHEFTIGELTLGVLPRGHRALMDLSELLRVPTIENDEVLQFVRMNRLEGSGIGWVDAHILAATKAAGASLWTSDRSLMLASAKAGVAVEPP